MKSKKTKTKKSLKRALSLLIVMLMLVSVVPANTVFAKTYDTTLRGTGTADDPFLLSTADDLKEFSRLSSTEHIKVYVELTNDINLNPGLNSVPCSTKPYDADELPVDNHIYHIRDFEGVFDGNGHTISGLFTEAGGHVGWGSLFSITRHATVKNLNIARSGVNAAFNGGIINYCEDTTIINCHVLEDAYFNNDYTVSNQGAIVGKAFDSRIINCSNRANMWDLYQSHRNRFGGIVGYAKNTVIEGCVNYGNIDRLNYLNKNKDNQDYIYRSDFGGIVGWAKNCVINRCVNYGTIAKDNPIWDGKFLWYDISSGGGIVGRVEGKNTITGCVNAGSIYGKYDCKVVGSIIGNCGKNSVVKIRDTLNNGTVFYGKITGSYEIPDVFIGNIDRADVTIDNCFSIGSFIYNLENDGGHTLKINNSYYSTIADGPVKYSKTSGDFKPEYTSVNRCTSTQYRSGEIAYNLSKRCGYPVTIGQDIGSDTYPVLDGKKVYYGYKDCLSTEKTYGNEYRYQATGIGHQYNETGKCTLCGAGGSADCPYPISTAEDLKKFADAVNGGATSLCAVLKNDIDLNPGTTFSTDGSYTGDAPTKWTPIGSTETYKYCGTFDGNGHTIRGLYTTDTYCAGLFSYCDKSDDNSPVIRNINIDNSHIAGRAWVGSIVGYMKNGTLTNCSTSEDVYIYAYESSGMSSGDNGIAGGIVGWSSSCEITYCNNASTIISAMTAGGIVGDSYTDIISICYNTGNLRTMGNANESYAGGIAGEVHSSRVSDVYNTGDVVLYYGGTMMSQVYPNGVGGILGYGGNFSLSGAYNTGNLSAIQRGLASVGKGVAVGYASNNDTNTIERFYYTDQGLDVYVGTVPTCENAEAVTTEQLASGEVTYKLNYNKDPDEAAFVLWRQDLALDATPTLSGKKVYLNEDCTRNPYYANYDVPVQHYYTLNGKCNVCGAYEDEMSAIYGYSATLGGNIGMNFIMEIDEAYQNDDTCMNFSVVYIDLETSELKELYTKSVPLSDAKVITVDGKNYYQFTCDVAAKEMSCGIKGRLVNGDKKGAEFSTSVAEYAYYLLNSDDSTDRTKDLVKSMLNFGAYAQEYFGFNTDFLVNCDLSDEDKKLNDYKASDYAYFQSAYKQIIDDTDIGYYGSSLVLEANTEVKHYFTFDSTKTNIDDIKAKITYKTYNDSGIEYEADYTATIEKESWGDNKGFYLKITDIPPHYYSKKFTLHIYEGDTEQCTLNFTPISYFYSVLKAYPEDDGVHDSLRNLVKAYYNYGVDAFVYSG